MGKEREEVRKEWDREEGRNKITKKREGRSPPQRYLNFGTSDTDCMTVLSSALHKPISCITVHCIINVKSLSNH